VQSETENDSIGQHGFSKQIWGNDLYRQPERSRQLKDFPSDTLGHGKRSLNFLQRRLVKSHTAVVVPFDDRVIFVQLPDCAELSRRYAEVA
jgi:hypothetical protein